MNIDIKVIVNILYKNKLNEEMIKYIINSANNNIIKFINIPDTKNARSL